MQARITGKGQVTLPKAIRDGLQLESGNRVEFMRERDDVLRVAPVTQLKGMLPKPAAPVTLQEIEEAIAKSTAKGG